MVEQSIEQAFLKLYDDFADSVFRHCYFRVSDREKAKDLAQETFKKLWEVFVRSDTDVQNPKAFVFKIANNLIIDSYRKKKEDSLDRMQEDGFDIGIDERESIMNMLSGREITELLHTLEPIYRDPIVMRHIDDLPVKEIAVILKETENVISVRIHRGLRKIRNLINSHE
jgi:RNA polymerase sigma-70 factor (ECF subfamily)